MRSDMASEETPFTTIGDEYHEPAEGNDDAEYKFFPHSSSSGNYSEKSAKAGRELRYEELEANFADMLAPLQVG